MPARRLNVIGMHLPVDATPDTPRQRAQDRARLRRAFNLSLAAVLGLCLVFVAQRLLPVDALAVAARTPAGLLGVLTAPLLHGGWAHLGANAIGVLLLGTLAGTVYPKATLRALPLLWLGSGLGAWGLGDPGSHHLGASGVTHGLMFLVLVLGLLRRDRPAIAASMIAFLFYGGMLLSILPQEAGVSWQSHLGGAIGGVLGALAFRRADPPPPRKLYSWETEHALEPDADADADALEPPRPDAVPVLWQRPTAARGTLLRFPDRKNE